MDEPSELVDRTTLRQMFNDGNYWHRALYADLYQAPVEKHHIQRRRSGQPPCTHSELMAYLDERGRQVAIVHQFRRPDGSLGGEGRPDPKALLHDGVLYILDNWRR